MSKTTYSQYATRRDLLVKMLALFWELRECGLRGTAKALIPVIRKAAHEITEPEKE